MPSPRRVTSSSSTVRRAPGGRWPRSAARRSAGRAGAAPPPAPRPEAIQPMLAELPDRPFSRAGWLFEIKWDGFRAVAEVRRDVVRLYSRNQADFLETFPPVVEDLKKIGFEAAFDGESAAVAS